MSPVAALTQLGAPAPLLDNTCPETPAARSPVVFVPVWYGISPAPPPAILVALPAVKPVAVPVALVSTPEAGVPKAGVIKVGEVNVPVVTVGFVRVLLVNVSTSARVAKVPVVGKTTVPVPAMGFAFNIVVPLVLPAMIRLPTFPAAPKVLGAVMV